MTKQDKIKLIKSITHKDLLYNFEKYAGRNLLEVTDSERESYQLIREEILNRMKRGKKWKDMS